MLPFKKKSEEDFVIFDQDQLKDLQAKDLEIQKRIKCFVQKDHRHRGYPSLE